jgi:hypothetical protein
MSDITYYVLMSKDVTITNEQRDEIDKVEPEFEDTQLPFSEEFVDIYLISDDKNECEIYIKNLSEDIQDFFYIEQVGADIQYTAFLDILGFSDYIKSKITDAYEAQEFYDDFKKVIHYLLFEKKDELGIYDIDYLRNTTMNYSWISDTFVISIEYKNEIKKDENHIISFMMLFRLSMIIAQIHHFMASKFEFTVRGAISSKYSCITDNFILGEGVTEASKLEKDIAIYPRVIFEEDIINSDIYTLIHKHYKDNDLNFISKDCDGLYFVNYLAMLQDLPPVIGNGPRIPDDKLDEYSFKLKIGVIEKYRKIVENGLKIPNKKITAKYTWLSNYLERVVKKINIS